MLSGLQDDTRLVHFRTLRRTLDTRLGEAMRPVPRKRSVSGTSSDQPCEGAFSPRLKQSVRRFGRRALSSRSDDIRSKAPALSLDRYPSLWRWWAAPAFLISLIAGSCTTTPRYYKEQYAPSKIACFHTSDVPKYELVQVDWKPDSPELTTLVDRLDKNFTSPDTGIVPDLFDCTRGPANDSKSVGTSQHIRGHVAAFTEPFISTAAGPSGVGSSSTQPAATASPTTTPALTAPTPTASPSPGGGPASTGDPYANFDTQLSQQVTLIISAYLYTIEPADRLSHVFTLIEPLSEGVTFQSVPGTRTVNLLSVGSVTTQNQLQFTLSTPSTAPVNAQAQPAFSRQLQEAIAKQYTTQNVEIYPLRNILFVSQNAGPGSADITGNTITSVTMQFPPDLCSAVDVWRKLDTRASSTPQVSRHHQHRPAPAHTPSLKIDKNAFEAIPSCYIRSVYGLVASVAVARTVDAECVPHSFGEILSRVPSYLRLTRKHLCGADTIPEDDDVAKLVAFKNADIIELWRNPNRLYGVALKPVGGDYGSNVVVVNDANFQGPLLFGSATDALSFIGWLRGQLRESTAQHRFLKRQLAWANNQAELGSSEDWYATPEGLSLCVYSPGSGAMRGRCELNRNRPTL